MTCPRFWSSLSMASAAESYEVFLSALAFNNAKRRHVQDGFWYVTVKPLSFWGAFTEFNCSSVERSWLEEREKNMQKTCSMENKIPCTINNGERKYLIFAYKWKFGGKKKAGERASWIGKPGFRFCCIKCRHWPLNFLTKIVKSSTRSSFLHGNWLNNCKKVSSVRYSTIFSWLYILEFILICMFIVYKDGREYLDVRLNINFTK